MVQEGSCYQPLSTAALAQIDEAGRRILAEVGIRITSEEYLDLLARAGAEVDRQQQRVRFPGDWLDQVLESAPQRFTLYSRDGRNDLEMGNGRVHFGNGGRVFRILDLGTGGYRRTMLRDIIHTAALVEQLDHIRFYIIACQAHDLTNTETYHLNDFFHAFNHTAKHVMGGCDTVAGLRQVWELASMIAGGAQALLERPIVSFITNPISPLTVSDETLHILRFCAEHGLPLTCAPAPISGTTAPGTLAGTLAQMHAEALAGVALVQTFYRGARVLYGAVPNIMDMRWMEFTMGSAETALMNAAAVQLAALYRLPIYASGGVTDAKRPDVQAGTEKTLSSLLVAQAGADCIHLAAGMLDSGNSISYEQYVIDNEIIGMIHRILAGIRVDEQTLGLDVIAAVGPGGNYVTEEHTVDHMMSEFYYPDIAIRSIFDIWEQQGRPDMLSHARDRVSTIIGNGHEGLLAPELVAAIEHVLPGIVFQ